GSGAPAAHALALFILGQRGSNLAVGHGCHRGLRKAQRLRDIAKIANDRLAARQQPQREDCHFPHRPSLSRLVSAFRPATASSISSDRSRAFRRLAARLSYSALAPARRCEYPQPSAARMPPTIATTVGLDIRKVRSAVIA